MQLIDAEVVDIEEIYPRNWVIWFNAPSVCQGAAVGQFVMVQCGDGVDPLLLRAFSIHRLRQAEQQTQWALLFTVVGQGTAWLARREPGDLIRLFGPLGHGYSVRQSARNLLLVAGGVGVAPLVWLADERIRKGDNVTLLLGARTADQLYPAERLPEEVEVITCTDDGSAGRKALVSELFVEYLLWADQAFACGPTAMLKALKTELLRAPWRKPVLALLEERMACGTGICYSCAVDTRHGLKLVCKDGPCFDLRDIV
jgi:dihydroorotate dehydrogenase electron transfer subunit